MRVLLLPKYSSSVGSSRLRTYLYLPSLKKAGYIVYASYLFKKSFRQLSVIEKLYTPIIVLKRLWLLTKTWDLIIIEKELFPYLPVFLERLFLARKKFILDYDDGVHVKYKKLNKNKIPSLASKAQLIFVGSEALMNFFKRYNNNVRFIPTPIEDHGYRKTDKVTTDKIVWIGQQGSFYNLEEHLNQILDFCRKNNKKLIVISSASLELRSDLIEFHVWSEETQYELICRADFGVMPLICGDFEKYKCSYKMLQYTSCGVTPIVTGIGENKRVGEKIGVEVFACDVDWGMVLEKSYDEMNRSSNLVALPDEYWLSNTCKVYIKEIADVLYH